MQLLLSALPLRCIALHQQSQPRRGKRARKKPLPEGKTNKQKTINFLFSCLRSAPLCIRKLSPLGLFLQGYTSAPSVAALSPFRQAAKKLLMHLGAVALIIFAQNLNIMKKYNFKSKANSAVRRQYIYSMSKEELVLYGRYLRFCIHYSKTLNEKFMYQNLHFHARNRYKNLFF